jgi:hypothetical protein
MNAQQPHPPRLLGACVSREVILSDMIIQPSPASWYPRRETYVVLREGVPCGRGVHGGGRRSGRRPNELPAGPGGNVLHHPAIRNAHRSCNHPVRPGRGAGREASPAGAPAIQPGATFPATNRPRAGFRRGPGPKDAIGSCVHPRPSAEAQSALGARLIGFLGVCLRMISPRSTSRGRRRRDRCHDGIHGADRTISPALPGWRATRREACPSSARRRSFVRAQSLVHVQVAGVRSLRKSSGLPSRKYNLEHTLKLRLRGCCQTRSRASSS